MKFDIFLVGVGGQGILTIGEILASVAQSVGIPANFFPSKGMAQRGGFVKAQLRMGRAGVGPNIPPRSADLVISMEQSEALKAVRFAKPGGDFVLFSEIWAPTAVMLGKAGYPTLETVLEQIEKAGSRLTLIHPERLPHYQNAAVAPNVYMLGVMMRLTALRDFFQPEDVDSIIQARWKGAAQANRFAFQAGLEFGKEAALAGQM